MKDRIEEFYKEYAACYQSQDYDAVVAKLCVPLAFLSDSGPLVIPNQETLLKNFRALIEQYKRLGITEFTYYIEELQSLSNKIYLAKLQWSFKRKDGSLVYSSNTSYFLLVEPSQIRIIAVLLHDEQEKKERALRAINKI